MKPEDGIEKISGNVMSSLQYHEALQSKRFTTSACFLCVQCGRKCVLQINTFGLQYNTYITMFLAAWRLTIRHGWYNIFINSIRVFSQYLIIIIIINIWQNLFYCLWIFAHFLIEHFKETLKAMVVEHCLIRLFWKVTASDRYLPLYTFL
jgi:hypothetical protein